MSGPCHVLALDIGGTKLAAAIMNIEGRVVRHSRLPTKVWEGPTAIMDRLFTQADELLEHEGLSRHELAAVGIGTGGPLDLEAGTILYAPNMPGWVNLPVRQIVFDHYACPTYLDNDANVAALGEYWFGAGQKDPNLVYMTVSTGIGGGILIDGHIFHGTNGNAAEFGHVVIDPDGPACGCGGRGCLEALASGTNIARRAKEALAAGRQSSVLAMAVGQIDMITAELVAMAAEEGDAVASEIFTAAAKQIGLGLVGVVHVLNPSLVIVGGGVASAGELLIEPIREVFRRHGMRNLIDDVRLVTAGLGKDVGVISARNSSA